MAEPSKIDQATNDQLMREILKLTEVIHSSKIFNGGFDKMEVTVNNMSSDLQDLTKKVDTVYAPDTGLFSRVRDVEAWKASLTKVMWWAIPAFITGIGAIILEFKDSIFK